MATYWENSCSFGLRYVSWYKYLIVSLVFSHLSFWSGNLFLIAPFPDLCLLVPFSFEIKPKTNPPADANYRYNRNGLNIVNKTVLDYGNSQNLMQWDRFNQTKHSSVSSAKKKCFCLAEFDRVQEMLRTNVTYKDEVCAGSSIINEHHSGLLFVLYDF